MIVEVIITKQATIKLNDQGIKLMKAVLNASNAYLQEMRDSAKREPLVRFANINEDLLKAEICQFKDQLQKELED
jgi:hypothetical protein